MQKVVESYMIKGILFDKDGTIIDFYALWLNAALDVMPKFLEINDLETSKDMLEFVLATIGVYEGEIDPKGALAYKSYPEIAEDLVEALLEKGMELNKEVVNLQLQDLFDESVTGDHVELKTFGDMKVLIRELKDKGIKIGLSTADTLVSAESCLKTLNLYDEFDFIGADDGIRKPKPAPDMFVEFAQMFGFLPEEIMVAGDTENDIRFANDNGGVSVGVLSGVSKREDYGNHVAYVVDSIFDLPTLLERI